MARSKPTRATRHIHTMADYSEQSGASVDWCSSMETFCISCDGEDDIFMQGHEASAVICEIESMCRRFPSLDEYTAALYIAKSYIETFWS